MIIVHDSTVKMTRGWQSVIRVENDNDSIEGLVIRHDARTAKVMNSSMEEIEAALDRENIIDRCEFITQKISSTIEESLIDWLAKNKNIEYRFIRWKENTMVGFQTRDDASNFDRENEAPKEHVERKRRIMLG